MIETTYLEPSQNGRVGVVVPHGVLFRGGAESRLRVQFIEENLLDAVIGLPPNLFYGTGIPAALLIFKRNRTDRKVFFIDASREFDQIATQNRLREEDIERILAAYRERESVDKYAYLAGYDEIVENDFNLNIPRYVDTFEPEPAIDLVAIEEGIEDIRSDLRLIEKRMQEYISELGLNNG